jgi:hypothetical protein
MSGPTLEACGTSATLTSDQHTRSDASTRRGNGGTLDVGLHRSRTNADRRIGVAGARLPNAREARSFNCRHVSAVDRRATKGAHRA